MHMMYYSFGGRKGVAREGEGGDREGEGEGKGEKIYYHLYRRAWWFCW